ncbi:homoserine O-acetyltransferase [Pseudanabaena sp. 'Roaring Creek']|uniref:homoserine O-acetyltransferase MetX n=1 Tax=Pseudanabaena sp. 'Roaring Creek' TaxID=1681830 RepID=UPI0006D821B8|nr:homoserine O-acetyltransferase [Pseudanabaena sp. 'Roaring Creek']
MKYRQFITDRTEFYQIPYPLALELGDTLFEVQIAYRTWGTLNAKGDNAILICHGFTANADADLWWHELFGEGKIFDPSVDFIVCSNILGSCYGTTGAASIDPATGKTYGANFPAITIRDMVRSQAALMEGLGIKQWKLVTGGSLGGMQTLEWAVMYPDLIRAIAPIATSGRHSAWSIALGEAQRQAIYADPHWHHGFYDHFSDHFSDQFHDQSEEKVKPDRGLAIARMIATCSYYGHLDFEQRFSRQVDSSGNFAIVNYLQQEGQKLVARFDANAYVSLTKAMDTHDLGRDRGDYYQVLANIPHPTIVVATGSDLLYFAQEQEELAQFIPQAKLAWLDSIHGHDSFLIALEQLNQIIKTHLFP